jgi:hypothetical protein
MTQPMLVQKHAKELAEIEISVFLHIPVTRSAIAKTSANKTATVLVQQRFC